MNFPMVAFALLLILGVLIQIRFQLLRKQGVNIMHFGNLDKTDFLIPPVAFFYFYHILANAFEFPSLAGSPLVNYAPAQWLGIFICLCGIALVAWSLKSFGNSLRVGIDVDAPGVLVTTGAFAVSRNPLYVGFLFFLLGQFLLFPTWMFLAALVAALWLMNRQIIREEDFLRGHYGAAFDRYSDKVRRYL